MKPTGRDPDQPFERFLAHGLAREADASGNACPDADLLAAWFDHTLSAVESERIEAHAAGCECCQQILAALARSEPEVIRAAPLPAPARPWHWHWRWAVPLATAVLVVVVGSRTLRAPGPAAPPVALKARVAADNRPAGPFESRLRPSGSGEAGPGPSGSGEAGPSASSSGVQAARQSQVQLREKQAPSQAADASRAANAAPAPAEAVARPVAVPMPAAPPPPPPPRAEAAPVAAPVVAQPQAAAPIAAPAAAGAASVKPESQLADAARRQAAPAGQNIAAVKTAAQGGLAPPVSESVAVKGEAPLRDLRLSRARQPAVVTPAAAGSVVRWRFGQDGAIDRSSDRGETWERQSSGVTTALNAASAPSDLVCWIVGVRGVVLRTTDGRSWQRLSEPTGADLMAVYAANDLSAAVTAADRSVYETADGGRTWTRRR